jgi:hypothetical protein
MQIIFGCGSHEARNALAQWTKPAGVIFAQAKGMTAAFLTY